MKNNKNLVVAIVLLVLLIAGMVLRSGASAKDKVPEEKGAYASHWLTEDTTLMDSVVTLLRNHRETDPTIGLHSIEWEEEENRWCVWMEGDHTVIAEYVYDYQ